jgi:hypothetical protein
VVLEVCGGAALAYSELRGQTVEAAQTLRIRLVAKILEEPERAAAGCVDPAVHAFRVIFVTFSECFDKGIRGSTNRAHTGANGEV